MTLNNQETRVTPKNIKSIFDNEVKVWKWYNYVIWWVRYGIWNKVRDLSWQIPNIYSRMRRGWGKADTWEFCDYLSDVIVGGLKHLKKIKHGYPATFDSKTNKLEYNEKRWDKILDEIIWTFEVAQKMDDTIRYLPTEEWSDKKYLRLCKIVKEINKKYPRLEQNTVLTKKESGKYEQGFRLFAKYFHSLWD